MSTAPDDLVEAREYLQRKTGLPPNALGIVGGRFHTYGYHLGKDRLPRKDYSASLPRDVAGLSNDASALDIGRFPGLVDLTAHLLAEAKAGRADDLRAIMGPARNGRAYRWDRLRAWKPALLAPGDSHEDHTHLEWFRDSRKRSKVDLFKRFFDGRKPADGKPPTLSWTERAVKSLPLLKQGATGADVRTLQGLLRARGHAQSAIDGHFGPKTDEAVKAFQRKHRLDADGIVGPKTWPKLMGV